MVFAGFCTMIAWGLLVWALHDYAMECQRPTARPTSPPEPIPVLCTGCGEVRDDIHMHWLRDGRYRCTLCVLNPVKEFH